MHSILMTIYLVRKYKIQCIQEDFEMVCNNCGTPLKDGVHFCPKCGIKLTSTQNFTQTTRNSPGGENNGLMVTLVLVLLILVLSAGCFAGYFFINYDKEDDNAVNYAQPTVAPTPTPQGFACLQATTQGPSNSLTNSKAPFASLILL